MNTQNNRRKFKNYFFVNKAQVTIFISNIILLLIIMGLFLLFVLRPFYVDMLKTTDIYMQNLASKYFIVLMQRCTWVFFIILIPLLLQQGMVIHKICGPFVRFKKVLDDFSMGNFSKKVYLRKYDFFHKEADQINEILDKLSSILTTVNHHQHAIIRKIESYSASGKASEVSEEVLKHINDHVGNTIKELSKIKGI